VFWSRCFDRREQKQEMSTPDPSAKR
jgi:hypothetical protein